eukprot:5643035-Prymnesium_polylepis.2
MLQNITQQVAPNAASTGGSTHTRFVGDRRLESRVAGVVCHRVCAVRCEMQLRAEVQRPQSGGCPAVGSGAPRPAKASVMAAVR